MGCYLRVPVLSQSQLKKNQAELLIPNQQVENPIHAQHGSWPFPTVKDLFHLLGW